MFQIRCTDCTMWSLNICYVKEPTLVSEGSGWVRAENLIILFSDRILEI